MDATLPQSRKARHRRKSIEGRRPESHVKGRASGRRFGRKADRQEAVQEGLYGYSHGP